MVKPTPPIAPEAPLRSDAAFSAKAQAFLTWLSGGFYSYVGNAVDFVDERADEALAAATTFGFPSIAGKALNFTRVNPAGTALEFRTAAQVRSDIGATAIGASVFTAADAAAARAALGLNSDPENRIINGAFDFWQRGTSLTSNAYGADRWFNGVSGGTVTMSRQAFTIGDTLGSNSAAVFLRQSVSGQSLASHYAVTQQRIEGVRSYAGQTITVLGWARRSSGAGNMAVEVVQTFGTGGSPSAEVTGIGQPVALTGSWAPFAVTVAVPSVAGKTLGTDGNDRLELLFWTSAGSNWNTRSGSLGLQTIGVDLWGIHIKLGVHTTAAVEMYRQPELGPELLRCQRYFRVGTIYGWGHANNTTPPWRASLERFGTEMRGIPSIAFSGATYFNANNIATDGGAQRNGFGVRVNVIAVGSYQVDAAYTADSEI
jgi:hypothetical protein